MATLAIPKQGQKQEPEEIVERAVDFHGHLGPFLVLGVRMGLIGLRELEVKKGNPKLRVTVMTKPSVPFSCVIDGIQTATKCTVGNRKLKLQDSSGNIATSFQILDEDTVTVTLNPAKQEELHKLVSEQTSLHEVEEIAREVFSLPEEELFEIEKKQSSDLNVAEERLKQRNLALVIAKGGKVVFETSSHGIRGLLGAIEELDEEMKGSSVADRIVGKAAALLCAYAGVVAVFAVTASEKGIQALRDSKILCRFENRVPHILNSKGSDICPFEKLVTNISNPKKAYETIKISCG